MLENRLANWNDVRDILDLISDNKTTYVDNITYEVIMRRLLYHPRYANWVFTKNNKLLAFLSIERMHIFNLYEFGTRVIAEFMSDNIDQNTEIQLQKKISEIMKNL